MRNRIRSGVLAMVLPVFLSVFSGCTEMVRPELDETHAKLQALQELVGAVNRDLTTLDLIVKELDDGHTILPESLQSTENGYEVSFRDGKKIFIPFGQDGVSFIPVGVKDDVDGLYYWQVDGEWLLDEEEQKIRAGATDGFVPLFKVEEGFWYISLDGGAHFEQFKSCEEMDGFGVFKDIQKTAQGKVILTLWNGEAIELVCQFPFRMSFADPVRDTMLIAGGEKLPIPYKLLVEGETDEKPVVTSGTDGIYLSGVEMADDSTGVVTVQAPAVFEEGYIFLSASCGGYSALKMITFRPREITPAESYMTVRFGSGSETKALPYEANFEYVVTSAETWLEIVSDPETGMLTFTPQPNSGDKVRECTVTVSPKDNPSYVCTTFQVIQATDVFSVQLEEGSAFSYDSGKKTLNAPAEGGDACLWFTFSEALSAAIPETEDWIQVEMVETDGFQRLIVQVQPEVSGNARETTIDICRKTGSFVLETIKVIQAGASAGE